MRKSLSAFMVTIVLALMCSTTAVPTQAQTAGERFGIGKFSHQNNTFVGLVMRYPTEPQENGGVVAELPAAAQAANQTGLPNGVPTSSPAKGRTARNRLDRSSSQKSSWSP